MKAYDMEIISVIKQLHESRHEIWKKKQEGQIEEYNKHQHLFNLEHNKLLYFFVYHYKIFIHIDIIKCIFKK